eukprot:8315022-Pyramimonas_sp.AAC.1
MENVPPLPSAPGTPTSCIQCTSAPPSGAASRAASPGAVSLVLAPPKAESPGLSPPPTVLAAPPPEAAGHAMPGGLQFYAQIQPRLHQARVSK